MSSELHQSLMDQAYLRWQDGNNNWSMEEFHDQLTPQERFAVHTGNFNYQVENGGFVQWWDNRYGTPATVEFLLRACDRVGTETAAKVKDLIKQFKSIMRDKDPHKHIDQEQWEDIHASLEEADLDKKYYEINEQFMADCEEHLKKGGY